MKKILFIALILIGINTNAQNHEVKIDVLDMVAFKTLDLTYQYNLNEESSVGLSVFTPLSDGKYLFEDESISSFRITPYYRHYFQLAGSNNFFADAFLTINSGTNYTQDISEKDYTDGAFGFNVGKAYISPRGFVLEGFIGGGRNLFESDGPDFIIRLGVNAGYRF